MALLAYDFKRKATDIISNAEYIFIDSAKETKTCEALVQKILDLVLKIGQGLYY
ncbi:hypothetical protein POX_a01459 [Penicillium oxalicum]|uniref:hypothetical protein n=1 Tax=Penicillium oxalicum TaxID=69781 RepID=UPI0020B775AF|nr:hypothetical protein POX_a01459 [Penicillium oxalicum]KAI2794858.1 hypothetical protein POX_a01459 [Penicillium oxalicum]